jgi:hypothetical protein
MSPSIQNREYVRVDAYDPPTMSARTHTPHLVVRHDESVSAGAEEQLCLTSSPRLVRFFEVAARVGLDVTLAVRLALERALVLVDGQSLRLGSEQVRRLLNEASEDARATCPLSAQQAAYVRLLYSGSQAPPVSIGGQLNVTLPDDLMTRARTTVSETALHEGVVAEMLAWERAASLEGRTMLEWALVTLGRYVSGR